MLDTSELVPDPDRHARRDVVAYLGDAPDVSAAPLQVDDLADCDAVVVTVDPDSGVLDGPHMRGRGRPE